MKSTAVRAHNLVGAGRSLGGRDRSDPVCPTAQQALTHHPLIQAAERSPRLVVRGAPLIGVTAPLMA